MRHNGDYHLDADDDVDVRRGIGESIYLSFGRWGGAATFHMDDAKLIELQDAISAFRQRELEAHLKAIAAATDLREVA